MLDNSLASLNALSHQYSSFYLTTEANGKDRRVHYAEDDDFEDLSLDELRVLVSLDHQVCVDCRSRMIFCDGTQPFCLNKKVQNLEVEPEEVIEEARQVIEEGEEKNRRRHNRRKSAVRKEASSNTNGERESSKVQSFQPSDNDVILSLRDSRYKKLMFETFRKLGAKRDSERDREAEKEAKVEVFNSLMNSGFRLVKLVNHRKPDLGCIVVDETYARDSKYMIISFLMFWLCYHFRIFTCFGSSVATPRNFQ